jgi:hypothetical protein
VRKCKDDETAVAAFGGEINKTMMHAALRATKRNYPFTLFINGRDLKEPSRRKNRNRNREFITSMARANVGIGILPWSTKHKLHRMKNRNILKLYKKSAEAIGKVLQNTPFVAHVEPRSLKKGVVKTLVKNGYTVVGNAANPDIIGVMSEKDLDRNSFIAISHSHDSQAMARFMRHIKGASFELVSLQQCLGLDGIFY